MIKLVPDTNVLVKGFISAINIDRQIINLAMAGQVCLYGSEASYSEYRSTIRKDKIKALYNSKHLSVERMENLYSSTITQTLINDPAIVPDHICSDQDDIEFIRIAIASGSRIIVSEDKHLTKIQEYNKIKIVRPERFILSLIKAQNGRLFL